MSNLSSSDLALGDLVLEKRNLRLSQTRNTTLSKIYRVVLIMLGIAVVLLFLMAPFPYVAAPYWISTMAVDTEFWGYVAKNVDAARAHNEFETSAFPYKGYEVAMSLAGWFPGLYRSWFFGSGKEGMIPNILYFSSISQLQAKAGLRIHDVNVGKTMAELSADPAFFALFLQFLLGNLSAPKAQPGESQEMAIVCAAWKAAGVDFGDACDVPPNSKGSQCNGGSIAAAGVSGAIGGAMVGAMLAPETGGLSLLFPFLGGLFGAGGSAVASAASQKCF